MPNNGGQEDQKTIVYNDGVDDDEIDRLDKDLIQLCNEFGDNVNKFNNKQEYYFVPLNYQQSNNVHSLP